MLLVKFIYFSSAFLSLFQPRLREYRNISCAELRFLRTVMKMLNGAGKKVFKIIVFFYDAFIIFLCAFKLIIRTKIQMKR